MTFTERVVNEAAKQVGKDYIWGGKGDKLWTPTGLVPSTYFGYDCIGLIMDAIHRAGGPDWRGDHNAQTFYHYLVKQGMPNNSKPHLRYYGAGADVITHIALGVAFMETACLIIEAAGGGHLTVAPTVGAKVFCHFETRKDYVGSTVLPIF